MGFARFIIFSVIAIISAVSYGAPHDQDAIDAVKGIVFSAPPTTDDPSFPIFKLGMRNKLESQLQIESLKTKNEKRVDFDGRPFTAAYHSQSYYEITAVLRDFDATYALYFAIKDYGFSIFEAHELVVDLKIYHQYLEERATGHILKEISVIAPEGISYDENDPEKIKSMINWRIGHVIGMRRLSYRMKWRASVTYHYCAGIMSFARMMYKSML